MSLVLRKDQVENITVQREGGLPLCDALRKLDIPTVRIQREIEEEIWANTSRIAKASASLSFVEAVVFSFCILAVFAYAMASASALLIGITCTAHILLLAVMMCPSRHMEVRALKPSVEFQIDLINSGAGHSPIPLKMREIADSIMGLCSQAEFSMVTLKVRGRLVHKFLFVKSPGDFQDRGYWVKKWKD
ncbi:MAG: hypothetical protein AAB649_01820 [Patescibacteria group bacterium]